MSGEFSPVVIPGKFGYGTMSLTWKPTPIPTEQSLDSLKFIIEHEDFGTKFLNAGEFYGPDDINLKLMKQFVDGNSDATNRDLIISIKGGLDGATLIPDGSKESIKRSIENIISYFPSDPSKRPKLLFESARVDPKTPYDETIGYIAEYVKNGKIDGISLSEVGINSIRKAHSVFPISCVELELSLMCQDLIENGVLEELSKLQIPIIAYSPLLRGVLTDHAVESGERFLKDMEPGDVRSHLDKFSEENYKQNLKLAKKLYEFAHDIKKTSLESLALSWIVALSGRKEYKGIKNLTRILPIPSGSTREKIEKNFSNLVELSDDDMEQIDKICQNNKVVGYRYNKDIEFLNFA